MRAPRRRPPTPARALGRIIALLAATTLAIALLPAAASAQGPELDARSWLLLDARDGTRLAGHRAGRPLPIASATKLMTAHVALDELGPRRRLRAPAYDANPAESILGLRAGERMSVEDLVTAMMLPSANDAAVTLAEGASGSVRAFVGEMNRAADELDLADTSFANPIGLDAPDNHSSARDLAALTLELRERPLFRRIVAQPRATLSSDGQERTVETRNTLLLADPSVDGVKTGHTLEAGYVLIASARRQGIPLLSVLLGADSEQARDTESTRLLDFGFSLYQPRRLARRGEQLGSVPVRYEGEDLPVTAGRTISVSARADQQLELVLDLPDEVEGPVAAGERLGAARALLDGEAVSAAPLRAARAIEEPGPFARGQAPVATALIVGGAIAILVGLLLAIRRRGAGSGKEPT